MSFWQRIVIAEERASWSHPEIDVLASLQERIEPIMEQAVAGDAAVRRHAQSGDHAVGEEHDPAAGTQHTRRLGGDLHGRAPYR